MGKRLEIYTDGGSRRNPGPAGAGVWIHDLETSETFSLGLYLGVKTNNQAEYLGLLAALRWVAQREFSQPVEVEFFLDSKLVVEQIKGNWKVKNVGMSKLVEQCRLVIDSLPHQFSFTHVKRHKNEQADALANLAMDLGQDF